MLDLSSYRSLQMVVVMDPEDDGKPKIPQARRTADFVPPARERRYVFDKAFDAHLDNRALYTSTVKVGRRCLCWGTPGQPGAVHQHCQVGLALSVLVPCISLLRLGSGAVKVQRDGLHVQRCDEAATLPTCPQGPPLDSCALCTCIIQQHCQGLALAGL